MPSHMKIPPVKESSIGTLFCNTPKGARTPKCSHYALKRLQHEARRHMTTPDKVCKRLSSKPVTSYCIQQISEVKNSLTIKPLLSKSGEASLPVYTDIPDDPLQSDKAYTLAMEIVDALVNKDSSTLDQRLINYMQLPNTVEHNKNFIFPQPAEDYSFSREMQNLLETIEDPGIDQSVKNHAQLTYKNIALNFFLKALSHRDAALAKSAQQLLVNMESYVSKMSDAQQKLYSPTVTGQPPLLTPEERFDLQSTIIINKILLKAVEKQPDEILDKLSKVTRLSRHSDPLLQHYAGKVHDILAAVGRAVPARST